MKANVLRIGNHIEYYMEDSQDERQKWWELDVVDAETILHFQSYPDDTDYRPIPLTEEWLIKFGFEKDDTGVDMFDQDYHEWYQKEFPIIGVLCQSSDKEYLFDENTDKLRIKYVHQLQNLYFALTSEELIYKN